MLGCKNCKEIYEEHNTARVLFPEHFCSKSCEDEKVSRCTICNDYYMHEDSTAFENTKFCSSQCENENDEDTD